MEVTATLQERSLASSLIAATKHRWALEITAVALGVTVVAVLAKLSLQIGPVPISGQTLGVLLVGAAYGARRGAVTMTGYMLAGLAGLPVFATAAAGPLYVLSPSFGFVIGFIPSAWLAGWLADRGWDRRVPLALLGMLAASIIPFVIGVPYMAAVLVSTGVDPTFAQVMEWGVLPFIPGGVMKAIVVALLLPGAWALRRRFISHEEGGR